MGGKMGINVKNRYYIKLIDTIEDIESIRDFWTKHQHHIYSDIDYYIFSSEHDPKFVQPFITVLYKNHIPVSMIIGRIAIRTLDWEIGPLKLGKSQTHCLEIGYHGFLGDSSSDSIKRMIEFLIQSLKKLKLNFIYFDRIDTESEIFKTVREYPHFINHDQLVLKYKNYRLQLPASFEEIYRSKSRNNKKIIRQYKNRLNNKFENQYEIKCYTDRKSVNIALADIHKVALKTYLFAMRKGFSNDEKTEQLWLYLADRHMLKAYVLYIQNVPRAYWVFYLYKGFLYSMYTGYDPEFSYYHLGFNLLTHIITESCSDSNSRSIDFGLGSELYKQIYGNDIVLVANFNIYNSTLKGQILKIVKLSTVGSTLLLKKFLTKLNLASRVKKLSRDFYRNIGKKIHDHKE